MFYTQVFVVFQVLLIGNSLSYIISDSVEYVPVEIVVPASTVVSEGSGEVYIGNNDLSVEGVTVVDGAVPVAGAVNFGGPVRASGRVTIAGRCGPAPVFPALQQQPMFTLRSIPEVLTLPVPQVATLPPVNIPPVILTLPAQLPTVSLPPVALPRTVPTSSLPGVVLAALPEGYLVLIGDQLYVAGTTVAEGAVPVLGEAIFGGYVSGYGTVTIAAKC